MAETPIVPPVVPPRPVSAPPPAPPAKSGGLLAELPYLVMLVMALGGVAVTSYTRQPQVMYWAILAPVFGLICIFTGWRTAQQHGGRFALVWTQALHWLAFIVAMRLVFLTGARTNLNDSGTGLTLLTLLALGTFVAGVHARTWQIAAVGALLALAVPAAVWLEQSTLLLFCAVVLVVAAVGAFLWARIRANRA